MSNANRFPAAPQHGPRPLPLFLDIVKRETDGQPALRGAALAGLARYQQAPRAPVRPPRPVRARVGRTTLRDFGGDGPPLVVVPSLINPPDVLDIAPDRSLMRWLATRGFRAMLVDWGHPDPMERDLSIAGHVERLLLPLLATLAEPPLLVGYCLGGTMALAAAARHPARALATIATPWRFAGFGQPARARIAGLWAEATPACEALGVVPMEVLQAGFWQLDPAALVAKYARYAGLAEDDPQAAAFVALEDWANGGVPVTLAAGAELFEDFFAADLPGRGLWPVAGSPVDPQAIPCPIADFVAATDRIVPAASAARAGDARVVTAGHVGMIVGRTARGALWEPLDAYLITHRR